MSYEPGSVAREVLEESRPFIRSIVAFLLYLRFDNVVPEDSYKIADEFLDQLDRDIEKMSERSEAEQ